MNDFLKSLIAVTTCVLLISNVAYSTCAPTTVVKDFQSADAVFLGKVTKIQSTEFHTDTVAVYFEVEKSWKGVDTREATIYAEPSTGEGYHFEEGETYVVYSYKQGDLLYTNECDKTAKLREAREQMSDLAGRSTIPLHPKASDENIRIVIITAISLLLFLGLGYIVTRFRKRAA